MVLRNILPRSEQWHLKPCCSQHTSTDSAEVHVQSSVHTAADDVLCILITILSIKFGPLDIKRFGYLQVQQKWGTSGSSGSTAHLRAPARNQSSSWEPLGGLLILINFSVHLNNMFQYSFTAANSGIASIRHFCQLLLLYDSRKSDLAHCINVIFFKHPTQTR